MKRSSSIRLATISLLGGAALVAASALAAVPATADQAPIPAALADRLTEQAGEHSAGAYVEPSTGRLVVAVTSAEATRQVRTAGVDAQVVDDSMQRLEGIQATLDRTGGATGMSWGIDVATNSVVVTIPHGQDNARTQEFLRTAREYGDAVRVERVPGVVRPMALAPGDAILTGSSRCSAAVIGTSGSGEFVVTAGHCTEAGTQWTTSAGDLIGNTADSSFPGNDYGLIQVADPGALGATNGSISSVGEPPAGSDVCKVGSTTGETCGTLVGYDRTVQYAEGTVTGLIETDVCVQPGDSGGLLSQGSAAVGIVSGGSAGGCGSGFQSFFQPVDEPLDANGLSLK